MTVRIILCLALAFSGISPTSYNIARGADTSPAMTVKLDIPEAYRDGKAAPPRWLGHRYPKEDRFYVVIENTGPKTVFIQHEDDVNRALHFEITGEDGKTNLVWRSGLPHEKYWAYDVRLAPGEIAVREIYYGRDWEKFPFPYNPRRVDETRKVTIRAVFEQAPSAERKKLGCWTGRVVSEPCEVTLVDDRV